MTKWLTFFLLFGAPAWGGRARPSGATHWNSGLRRNPAASPKSTALCIKRTKAKLFLFHNIWWLKWNNPRIWYRTLDRRYPQTVLYAKSRRLTPPAL